MELKFEAPKRERVHRYGNSITVINTEHRYLWWSHEERRWVTEEERKASYETSKVDLSHSSHCGRVRTLKAFKRHLRKHAEELRGAEVLWVNRYVGHNVSVQL